jgi:Mn2+/Fe2+ NRAMP family transporter
MAAFQIIRERLGPRAALANLAASFVINLLTLTAEVGGIALALQLASSVNYLLWVPLAGFAVWLVVWRVKFKIMENVTSLLGLCLIVFAVALFMLHPQWPDLGRQALLQVPPSGDETASYWYYAVGLFGSSVSPYEVFFFSSGAVEEHWGTQDLSESRLNVLVGFPLGGLLSISIAACTAVVLLPAGIHVEALSQVVLPLAEAGGKIALAVGIVGVVAAVFGASLETMLSSGYMIAQFFGWSWGKFRAPARAAQFHLVMILAIILAGAILLTGVDPIQLTEVSVVFSAVALPLTYVPILIIANDPEYLGEHVNGKLLNAVGIVFLVIIVVAAIAAIPLMVLSGARAVGITRTAPRWPGRRRRP